MAQGLFKIVKMLMNIVFQAVLSLWTKLSIWTPNVTVPIVGVWTIMSFRSCYLCGFLKPGYGKKIIKDKILFDPYIFLSQNFHQSWKGNTVWLILPTQGFCLTHIVFSRIFYKYPWRACILFLFQASFEKLESGTVDPYCCFRKIRSIFLKNTYGSLLNFFSIFLANSDQETGTVWPLLPFWNFNLKLIFFGVWKFFFV